MIHSASIFLAAAFLAVTPSSHRMPNLPRKQAAAEEEKVNQPAPQPPPQATATSAATPEPKPAEKPKRKKGTPTPPSEAVATPAPAAPGEPAEAAAEKPAKGPGFFKRVFGKKDQPERAEPGASPAPAQEATPEPTPKRRAKARPAPEPVEAAPGEEEMVPEPVLPAVARSTPRPAPRRTPEPEPESPVAMGVVEDALTPAPEPGALATDLPVAEVPKQIKTTPILNQPPPFVVDPDAADDEMPTGAVGDSSAADQAKYRTLRARVVDEPEVAKARAAAEAETNPAAKKEAYKRYYFLLYDRMRAEDSSLREWINRMEAAHLRRLERKKFVDGTE